MEPDAYAMTPAVDPGAARDLDRSLHAYAEQVSSEGADLARVASGSMQSHSRCPMLVACPPRS